MDRVPFAIPTGYNNNFVRPVNDQSIYENFGVRTHEDQFYPTQAQSAYENVPPVSKDDPIATATLGIGT